MRVPSWLKTINSRCSGRKPCRIVRQLLAEFTLPAVLAGAATWWAHHRTMPVDLAKFSVLDTFGARIFFFSWLIGQLFRVAKQHAVEDTLSKIERRVGDSINQLETKAADILRNMTGGTSKILFQMHPGSHPPHFFHLMIWADGDAPLIDVTLQVSLLANFRFDEIKRDSYGWSKSAPALCDEVIPVLHRGTFHQPPSFQSPQVDAFDLLVELGARNGRRTLVYRYKRFPGNPLQWASRRIEFSASGPHEVTNFLCSDDPWELVRMLTVEELAKPAS